MVGRAVTLERQRNYTKNKAKKIKNETFTMSNRENTNIANAVLKKIKKFIEPLEFYILGAPIIFSSPVKYYKIFQFKWF